MPEVAYWVGIPVIAFFVILFIRRYFTGYS